MRIAIDYTPAVRQGAGIGRLTRHLVRELVHLGPEHEFTLFVAGRLSPTSAERLGWPANVRLQDTAIPERWLTILWHRLRVGLPIEAFLGRCDLFHATDFVLHPTRAPALLTVHDLSFLRFPECAHPNLRRYLQEVVPRSLARAARILADSHATKEDLVGLLGVPAEEIAVVYGGIEPRFSPETDAGAEGRLLARYPILERPYILSVGTLEPRKNYVRLMQAYHRLHAVAPDVPDLVIAGGKGWLYEDIFRTWEALGLTEKVHFLGFVEEALLPALYRRAALFAFPSLYEGFGFPPLEAMASGVPVIASNASSLPEVVGDAGLLVDPMDVDALADAMRRGLEDAAVRADLRRRGLARAAEFTWRRAGEELLQQYRITLDQTGA